MEPTPSYGRQASLARERSIGPGLAPFGSLPPPPRRPSATSAASLLRLSALSSVPEQLRRMWPRAAEEGRLKRCAANLLILQILFVLRNVQDIHRNQNQQCVSTWTPEEVLQQFITDCVWLGISVPLLYVNIVRPHIRHFLPVVFLWYVRLLLQGFPPFAKTCDRRRDVFLHYREVCESVSSSVFLAVRNMNCGLLGHSQVQLVILVILVSPHLLPSSDMMGYNWIFVLLIYMPAISIYRWTIEPYYRLVDVGITAGLLCIVCRIASNKMLYLERSERRAELFDRKETEMTKKLFHIFKLMVPTHVIKPMLLGGDVIADQIDCASVLFAMIMDFNDYARNLTPTQLLDLLNETFTQWDAICTRHGVTKIETVGEEYVCAVGVVPDDGNETGEYGHALKLEQLVKVAADILARQGNAAVFKMGLHTGPLVAGVVGQKLPRFRLFGDTVNTAARMMQKGVPGELQFGEQTKQHLLDWIPIKHRGLIEMKGKGAVTTYLLDREALSRTQGSLGSMDSFEASLDPAAAVPLPPLVPPPHRHDPRRQSLLEYAMDLPDDGWVRAVGSCGARLVEEEDPESPATGLPSGWVELAEPMQGSSSKRGSSPAAGKADLHQWLRLHSKAPFLLDDESMPVCEPARGHSLPPEEELEFAEVALELTRCRSEFASIWYTVATCGLRSRFFTNCLEAEFQGWYHAQVMCRNLHRRMLRHIHLLSLLTAGEGLIYVLAVLVGECMPAEHIFFGRRWRFPVFLLCRAVSWAVLRLWVLAHGSTCWIGSMPQTTQWLLLLTYMLVTTLVFISEDAITSVSHMGAGCSGRLLLPNATVDDLNEIMQNHTRGSSVNSLVTVLLVVVLTTSLPFRFRQALLFMPFCAILMAVVIDDVWIQDGVHNFTLFFSNSGRIQFVAASMLNVSIAYHLERASRWRFKALHSARAANSRIDQIMQTLMPPLVVHEIRELAGCATLSHTYKQATIAQSDLVGFTNLASTLDSREVVALIGALFGLFDELTDEYGMYKIETIGDAYLAGQAERPLTVENDPAQVIRFGLGMVKGTLRWARERGVKVNCRVGIHTGECVGGIVGTDMQRYHLFGEFMGVLEVMESTAPEGGVQVSASCAAKLMEEDCAESWCDDFDLVGRGTDLLITSKGDVHHSRDFGGPTFVAEPKPEPVPEPEQPSSRVGWTSSSRVGWMTSQRSLRAVLGRSFLL